MRLDGWVTSAPPVWIGHYCFPDPQLLHSVAFSVDRLGTVPVYDMVETVVAKKAAAVPNTSTTNWIKVVICEMVVTLWAACACYTVVVVIDVDERCRSEMFGSAGAGRRPPKPVQLHDSSISLRQRLRSVVSTWLQADRPQQSAVRWVGQVESRWRQRLRGSVSHHRHHQSINQYYFIAAWQNAGPQFAQIKIQYSTIKYNTMRYNTIVLKCYKIVGLL